MHDYPRDPLDELIDKVWTTLEALRRQYGSIYTKDLFRFAEDQCLNAGPGDEFQYKCVDGTTVSAKKPTKEQLGANHTPAFYMETEHRRCYMVANAMLLKHLPEVNEAMRTQLLTPFLMNIWSANDPSPPSYSEIKKHHQKASEVLKKTAFFNDNLSILKSIRNFPKATKVICFALGHIRDLDEVSTGNLPRYRSLCQHLYALHLAKVFGEKQGKGPLHVMAQDPAYTEADKQFLTKDLGIEVIGGYGTRGLTYIDSETIVFTVAPDIPLQQLVADIATPAAMVWSPPCEHEITRRMAPFNTDMTSPRVLELLKGYKKYELAEDRNRFSELEAWVRKT